MKYVVCRIGLLAAVVSLVLAVPARAEQPPRIVISEVNWAGSARSTADEWIELANISAEPVDVGGWIVSGIASGGGAISLAEGTIVAAGDTLLIANYAMSAPSTLAVAPDLVTTAVSIANRALHILLIMPDGTVMDSAIDAGEIAFGSSQTFATMARNLTTLQWHTADTSLNLLDGQFGTPNAIDSIAAIATTVAEKPPAAEVPAEEHIPEEPAIEITVDIPAETPVATTLPEELPEETTPEPTISPELVVQEIAAEEESPAADSETPIEYVPVEQPIVEVPATPEPIVETVTEPLAEPAKEPTAESIEEATPEQPVSKTARTGNVVLSELVSNPREGDEWIEIMNADTLSVDISGWHVADASGKLTALAAVTLAPGTFHVITKPLGKLNNDADSITLYNSNHQVVATVSYAKDTAPLAGESLAWNGNTWEVTTRITAGSANLFPPPEEPAAPADPPTTTSTTATEAYASNDAELTEGSAIPNYLTDRSHIATEHNVAAPTQVTVVASATPAKGSATNSTKKSSSSTSKSSRSKSFASIRTVTSLDDVAAEERVQLTGTLIALPGTFGSQIAVVDGAMLYMHSADWPALKIGDVLRVQGTVSVSRGEKRIKVSAADIEITGQADVVAGALTNRTPSLVNVQGRVLSRDGDRIILDVNGEKITVRASATSGVTWSGLTTTTVAVSGVLRTIDGARVLMPRSTDDVQFLQEETLSEVPAATATSFNARPWIGGGLLASSAAALGYWFIRSRQQPSLIPA